MRCESPQCRADRTAEPSATSNHRGASGFSLSHKSCNRCLEPCLARNPEVAGIETNRLPRASFIGRLAHQLEIGTAMGAALLFQPEQLIGFVSIISHHLPPLVGIIRSTPSLRAAF